MRLRDKNKKFLPQPKGIKTPRMLSVEKKIGNTLEKDWGEYYLKKRYGFRKIAQRWGIRRNTLCGFKTRQGWIGILGLKKRKEDNQAKINSHPIESIKCCELCGKKRKNLVGAHFIPEGDGGPKCFFNILKLCQNCHDDLDDGNNKEIVAKARKILLLRANKALKLRLPPWRWQK